MFFKKDNVDFDLLYLKSRYEVKNKKFFSNSLLSIDIKFLTTVDILNILLIIEHPKLESNYNDNVSCRWSFELTLDKAIKNLIYYNDKSNLYILVKNNKYCIYKTIVNNYLNDNWDEFYDILNNVKEYYEGKKDG